jgi:hypothetical protein
VAQHICCQGEVIMSQCRYDQKIKISICFKRSKSA